MRHLVRHPRLQPFEPISGRFGMTEAYECVRMLGRGGSGQTWLCREKATGEHFALKMQQRPIPRGAVQLTYNEITIQAMVAEGSPHLTRLREVILSPSHLAMVLEFVKGGSVAEYVAAQISKVSRLELCVPEERARFLFKQLIAGVEYMHNNHICHRDIKLDNTLLGGSPDLPTVKLCDFQFAKYWGTPPFARMKTHLGTAVYMAPEIISNRRDKRPYDPVEGDVWACGIWLVALLVGAFPFDNRPGVDDTTAEMQVLAQEMAASWRDSKFVNPYMNMLSDECRDLLDRILHTDPDMRIGIGGILAHPWMTRPLEPWYQRALDALEREGVGATYRLQGLELDQGLIQQRNNRVWEIVRLAAKRDIADMEEGLQHLQDMCELPMIDCRSVRPAVRVDMRPEAVVVRRDARVLALLDSPPTPRTPSAASSGGGADGRARGGGAAHASSLGGAAEEEQGQEQRLWEPPKAWQAAA
eukprot:scaffold25.g5106.t1